MKKIKIFTAIVILILTIFAVACSNNATNSIHTNSTFESSQENIVSEGQDLESTAHDEAKESSSVYNSGPTNSDLESSTELYIMSDTEKYIYPFFYDLGRHSWNSADDIDPDAFVVFYISMGSTGEIDLDLSGPIDEIFGEHMFPSDSLENAVQRYFVFDVPSEYIRQSRYYNAEKDAYWTGGIGSVVDDELVSESREGDMLTLHFKSSITSTDYQDSWNCTIVLDLSGKNYRYVSFISDRKTED